MEVSKVRQVAVAALTPDTTNVRGFSNAQGINVVCAGNAVTISGVATGQEVGKPGPGDILALQVGIVPPGGITNTAVDAVFVQATAHGDGRGIAAMLWEQAALKYSDRFNVIFTPHNSESATITFDPR